MGVRENVMDLIQQLASDLDDEEFSRYLDKCADDFQYAITVETPELASTATWLSVDKPEMQDLLKDIKRHVRLKGRFLRQLGPSQIQLNRKARSAQAKTSFVTILTDLEGVSNVYAVGHYTDRITWDDDAVRLVDRVVNLHTRDLGAGSHVPL